MRILTACLIFLGTLTWSSMGLAGTINFINGAWSTSFDYGQECGQSPWDGGGPTPQSCAAISADGIDWTLKGSGGDTEALIAANNPDGDGGMGARFYVGDGKNNNASRLIITFPSQEPELWIRWYMRYEPGFAWEGGSPNYDKFLYMYTKGPGGGNGFAMIPGYAGGRLGTTLNGQPDIRTNKSWTDVFGTTSDGLFHQFEIYIKVNTSLSASNGIVRFWIDGVLEREELNISFTENSNNPSEALDGLKRIDFHSNQGSPSNGGNTPVDYDDMAIYTVTPPNVSPDGHPWIGPVNGFSGGGGSPPPPAPSDPVPKAPAPSVSG